MKFNNKLIISFLALGLSVPGAAFAACKDAHPVITVKTDGGGQRVSVNKTLIAAFRGNIMTTDGLTNRGRNVVKICPGTTVDYSIRSTVGEGFITAPDCGDRYQYGSLVAGDKISCNNKNVGGSDTDTFTIKVGR